MAGAIVGGVNINNLRYADDTVLIAVKEEDLQNLLDEVDKQGREFGMRMNVKKTKAMIVSRSVIRPGEMTCVASQLLHIPGTLELMHLRCGRIGKC